MFDLKKEKNPYSDSIVKMVFKMAAVGAFLGFLLGGIELTQLIVDKPAELEANLVSVKNLAITLFNDHVFGFEIISVLLLAVIVGAVTLARSRGGTHV